jgi:predicted acetyltransferase
LEIESNEGPFIIAIDRGHARVERGGRGEIEVDVRALAAMYSGFAHAYSMIGAGLLRGDASSLEAIFAGPEPWCCDHY